MYSLAEKNKILKLFKKGESVSSISLQSNVSKSTLYRWKKLFETVKEKNKQVKILIEQGKLEEAEKLAKEILEIDSDSLPTRYQLITIYKKQGKWDEVEKLAKEILQLEPDNLLARFQLITITIYKNQGKLDDAEKLAKEILQLKPDDLSARSQLITIYRKQGKWDEIERLANEILEINSNDLPARYQLITTYVNQGKLDEVIKISRESRKVKRKLKLLGQRVDLQSKPQQDNGIKRKADSKKEESKQNTIRSESINAFRKDIYDGKITLDNLSEYEEKISKLTPFEQKMLLAEAYTHWNLASNAVQLLKQASKLDGITDSQKKILSQAIQVAKATKMNPIARKKQWNSFSGSKEER